MSCLHEDTGDIWHQHVLGIDNGLNVELDASLHNNRANKAEYEAKRGMWNDALRKAHTKFGRAR